MKIDWKAAGQAIWTFAQVVIQQVVTWLTTGTAISWGAIITAGEVLIAALIAAFTAKPASPATV